MKKQKAVRAPTIEEHINRIARNWRSSLKVEIGDLERWVDENYDSWEEEQQRGGERVRSLCARLRQDLADVLPDGYIATKQKTLWVAAMRISADADRYLVEKVVQGGRDGNLAQTGKPDEIDRRDRAFHQRVAELLAEHPAWKKYAAEEEAAKEINARRMSEWPSTKANVPANTLRRKKSLS